MSLLERLVTLMVVMIIISTNTIINDITSVRALFLCFLFSRILQLRAMALYAAGQSGCISMCRMLLAIGSDVEKREPYTQFTPLHVAALNGHENIVQLLLSKKADVNPRSRSESTPLHCASQEGHLASVVALLQAGADPLLPQDDGALPIHQAAQFNHSEVVRILIESTKCSQDQVRHYTTVQCIDHRSDVFFAHKSNKIIFHHRQHLSSSSLSPLAGKHEGWKNPTHGRRLLSTRRDGHLPPLHGSLP